MNEFYKYFSNYINESDLQTVANAAILEMRVTKVSRTLEIVLTNDVVVDYSVIERIQKSICEKMNLNRTIISMKYAKSLFDIENIEKIISP